MRIKKRLDKTCKGVLRHKIYSYKLILLSTKPAILACHFRELSTGQTGEAEGKTGGNSSPPVRNLPNSSPIHDVHLKIGHPQEEANSFAIPLKGFDSINQNKEAEKTTGSTVPLVVITMPLIFIQVFFLRTSVSRIPPEKSCGSSIPVYWKPIIPVYHLRELKVLANSRRKAERKSEAETHHLRKTFIHFLWKLLTASSSGITR
jgi:hypothetical protein